MRCILRTVIAALVSIFAVTLLFLVSSAVTDDTDPPAFSLSDGSLRIQSPGEYLIHGCTESDADNALEIINNDRYGAVYDLTLGSAEGKVSRFPRIAIRGGAAKDLTVILHIEGEIIVEELQLSGYKSADIRLAASGNGKLSLLSVQTAQDAKSTSFSVTNDTDLTPQLPKQLTAVALGYTSDATFAFALSPKEPDVYTVEFIIPGIPDQHIFREVAKGGILTDIPEVEEDAARLFLGWSMSGQTEVAPDFSLPVESDMILYARFHLHNFSVSRYDADSHWQACDCGAISPDGKTSHDLCAVESPEYLISVANCTNAAKFRYSCSCGFVSEAMFESGTLPAKGHTEETKDNKIVCADCGVIIREIPPAETDEPISDPNDDDPLIDGKDPHSGRDGDHGNGTGDQAGIRSPDSFQNLSEMCEASSIVLPFIAAGILLTLLLAVVLILRRRRG